MNKLATTLVLLFLALNLRAETSQSNDAAQKEEHPHKMGHHHMPPKEAFEACKDKKDKEDCKFKNHHGEDMNGQCGGPEGKEMACMPEHHEHHHKNDKDDKN